MSGSTFTSNSASFGGGLANDWRDGDGERQLLHQQLRQLVGGGLDNVGTATVSGSSFTSNSASTASAAASTTRVAGRRR